MIREERVLVMDVDGTVCHLLGPGESYPTARPVVDVVDRVRELHAAGWYVIFSTSRRMRTHGGNVGAITAHVVPELAAWLEQHEVPFDEIHVGKPWAGRSGVYVDDRAIRPDEFVVMSPDELDHVAGV